MDTDKAIEFSRVVKTFGAVKALDDVSFAVNGVACQ